ncbi:hypothetical protein M9H77_29506 [Catharanthus roseus]|uniref:Uncharacterized protein n=1 Tax=Catharanthus roseus TaxID=4058 RepID=A0ACB9ZWJ7_CATRO|nr:hypothetical protein M9H77_29506 [Catharanthus roseus]
MPQIQQGELVPLNPEPERSLQSACHYVLRFEMANNNTIIVVDKTEEGQQAFDKSLVGSNLDVKRRKFCEVLDLSQMAGPGPTVSFLARTKFEDNTLPHPVGCASYRYQ